MITLASATSAPVSVHRITRHRFLSSSVKIAKNDKSASTLVSTAFIRGQCRMVGSEPSRHDLRTQWHKPNSAVKPTSPGTMRGDGAVEAEISPESAWMPLNRDRRTGHWASRHSGVQAALEKYSRKLVSPHLKRALQYFFQHGRALPLNAELAANTKNTMNLWVGPVRKGFRNVRTAHHRNAARQCRICSARSRNLTRP